MRLVLRMVITFLCCTAGITLIADGVVIGQSQQAPVDDPPDGGLRMPRLGTPADPILNGRVYCFIPMDDGRAPAFGERSSVAIHHDGLWTVRDETAREWVTMSGACIIWHKE